MIKETKQVFKMESVNGNGKPVKVLCGEFTWDKPEKVDELMDQFDDEDILKCFIYGKTVQLASEVRNPTKDKVAMTPSVRAFSKLDASTQDLMLKATPEQIRAALLTLGHSRS